MARHKNTNWNLLDKDRNGSVSYDTLKAAVLMDIRDELQALNRVFACPNFVAVPCKLDDINRQLRALNRRLPVRKPRKRKVA